METFFQVEIKFYQHYNQRHVYQLFEKLNNVKTQVNAFRSDKIKIVILPIQFEALEISPFLL